MEISFAGYTTSEQENPTFAYALDKAREYVQEQKRYIYNEAAYLEWQDPQREIEQLAQNTANIFIEAMQPGPEPFPKGDARNTRILDDIHAYAQEQLTASMPKPIL